MEGSRPRGWQLLVCIRKTGRHIAGCYKKIANRERGEGGKWYIFFLMRRRLAVISRGFLFSSGEKGNNKGEILRIATLQWAVTVRQLFTKVFYNLFTRDTTQGEMKRQTDRQTVGIKSRQIEFQSDGENRWRHGVCLCTLVNLEWE